MQKAWLNETDSLALGKLTERIGMFLNLNVTSRYCHMQRDKMFTFFPV